jgi:N-acetyltransferase 10
VLIIYSFHNFVSVLNPKINFPEVDLTGNSPDGFLKKLDGVLSPYDMERFRAYTANLVDFNLVYDICKTLAHHYFQEKLPVSLSYVQASVLLCLGLQESDFSSIERQMQLERGQIYSLLLKVGKKLYKYLNGIATKELESTLPRLKDRVLEPHKVSVDEDLREGAKEVEVIASVSVHAYILFWFPCKIETPLTLSMLGFKGTNEGKDRRIVGP